MSLKDLGNPFINSVDQEVVVTASISGLPNESYFRTEWQKSSGDTYFGNVKVGDNWVEVNASQDCKNYLHVTDTNTTSLSFLTKVGSAKNTTNGSYNLKIRRYTESCASYSDSDPVQVTLNLPTALPVVTPNPTSSPNPTPLPTKNPTPSPIKTVTTTIAPKITAVPSSITPHTKTTDSLGLEDLSQVLDAKNVLGLEVTPEPHSIKSSDHSPNYAFVLIGVGFVFVIGSIILAVRISGDQQRLR